MSQLTDIKHDTSVESGVKAIHCCTCVDLIHNNVREAVKVKSMQNILKSV